MDPLNALIGGGTLDSRFDVRKGLAGSTTLVLDTNHMSVVGDGKVNLTTEKLAISLRPSPFRAKPLPIGFVKSNGLFLVTGSMIFFVVLKEPSQRKQIVSLNQSRKPKKEKDHNEPKYQGDCTAHHQSRSEVIVDKG